MIKRKGSKVRRYMKTVMKLLSKARDLYVYGMRKCSAQFSYMDAATMGYLTVASSAGDSDLKEILKPSSIRSHGTRVEQKQPPSPTVQIGRIDEDKPCDFGNDVNVNFKPHISPRSRRSYAVRGRGLREL